MSHGNFLQIDHYLSYSRCYSFYNDFPLFTKNYILREREFKANPSQDLHRAIYFLFMDPEKIVYVDRKSKSDDNENSVVLNKSKKPLIDNIQRFFNLKQNEDLKKAFEQKLFEKRLISDKMKIQGVPDVVSDELIIDMKFMDERTFMKSKVRYGVQQYFIERLMKENYGDSPNFEFLLTNPASPYKSLRVYFPDEWIEEIKFHIDKTEENYFKTVDEIENGLGIQIFHRTSEMSEDEKVKIMNHLTDTGRLVVKKEIHPSGWDYKELEESVPRSL